MGPRETHDTGQQKLGLDVPSDLGGKNSQAGLAWPTGQNSCVPLMVVRPMLELSVRRGSYDT